MKTYASFVFAGLAWGGCHMASAQVADTNLPAPQEPTAGFAPLPTQYHYTVANGTGSYHHLNGAGTLTLSLTPGVSSDPLTQTGSFKMSLKKA